MTKFGQFCFEMINDENIAACFLKRNASSLRMRRQFDVSDDAAMRFS